MVNKLPAMGITLGVCFLFFFTGPVSAQQQANFFTADGSMRVGELLRMSNDTLYITITDFDGKKQTVSRHKSGFTKVVLSSGELFNLARSNWPDTSKSLATPAPVALAQENAAQLTGAFETEKQPSAKELPTIAIADFDGRGGVTASDAATLSDRFREKLIALNAFRVMERAQMDMILKEQGFQQSGACKDNECLVQMGQLVAVQKIISGAVGKVGGMYTVSIKMLSVQTGTVEQNISEDCDCPVEELLTVTMERLARRFAGIKVEEDAARKVDIKRGDASLFIKTYPDSARIYIDGKLIDGQTPLTIDNLTPGEHAIKTTKRDLSGFATIVLQGNKVGRLEIKLAKQQTMLKVATTPSEAEVYLNGSQKSKKRCDQLTPAIFENIAADTMQVTLFKVGYADTTMGIRIVKNEINNLSLVLNEAPVEVIKIQKRFVRHRSQRRFSYYLTLPGAACAVAGGGLYLLSSSAFSDAAELRHRLEKSAVHSGPDYEALVKENKDKNDAAVFERNLSYWIGGAGVGLLAAGLVLYF
jgi:hypothetical protein